MNEFPVFDGGQSRLYMKFDKALPSAQGMAIWRDDAFILYDTGVCAVYDLKTRAPAPRAVFRLGSFNDGTPAREYLNHANQCMFGGLHLGGNPIPLLYVTSGTGIGADADGFYYRMCVENIRQTPDGYAAETVQTVTYQPTGAADGFEPVCWGCPAFFADTEARALYIFSARYRTKRGCVPDGARNALIVTRFPLPALDAGALVRLTAADIRDQFAVDTDVQFTQGGQLAAGILHYTFGCPKVGYPDRVMAFDVRAKKALYLVDHLDEAFCGEEIECCDWYAGRLLCNTNGGSLFELALPETERGR